MTDLLSEAIAFCNSHGLLLYQTVKSQQEEKQTTQLLAAPFSLSPCVLSTSTFEAMTRLAPLFNKLVDRYSRDHEFLLCMLQDVVTTDSFTARLVEMERERVEYKMSSKHIHNQDKEVYIPYNFFFDNPENKS